MAEPVQVGAVEIPKPAGVGEKSNIAEGIENAFLDYASEWNLALLEHAKDIFITLAMVQLAWISIRWALGRSDTQSIFGSFFVFVFQTGLFYAFVLNPEWIKFIPDTFVAIGKEVAPIKLSASAIFDAGIKVAGTVTETVGSSSLFGSISTALIGGIVAIGIMLCFAYLGAQLVVTIVELAIVANMSSMILMFGALSFTRQIALQYIMYSIATGLKLLCLYIINAVAIGFANPWAEFLEQNADTGVDAILLTLGGAYILAYIGRHIPMVITGIVIGTPQFDGGGIPGDMFRKGTGAAKLGLAGVAVGAAGAAWAYQKMNTPKFNMAGSSGGANGNGSIGGMFQSGSRQMGQNTGGITGLLQKAQQSGIGYEADSSRSSLSTMSDVSRERQELTTSKEKLKSAPSPELQNGGGDVVNGGGEQPQETGQPLASRGVSSMTKGKGGEPLRTKIEKVVESAGKQVDRSINQKGTPAKLTS